eukprot:COSAG06_NODE_54437_length_294_cov_1.097436_1_plen_61_part_10
MEKSAWCPSLMPTAACGRTGSGGATHDGGPAAAAAAGAGGGSRAERISRVCEDKQAVSVPS